LFLQGVKVRNKAVTTSPLSGFSEQLLWSF
jgi:hypothetical protein